MRPGHWLGSLLCVSFSDLMWLVGVHKKFIRKGSHPEPIKEDHRRVPSKPDLPGEWLLEGGTFQVNPMEQPWLHDGGDKRSPFRLITQSLMIARCNTGNVGNSI